MTHPGIESLRQVSDGDGMIIEVHITFSNTDLCNTKAIVKGLSTDREEFINVMKVILCNHDPT